MRGAAGVCLLVIVISSGASTGSGDLLPPLGDPWMEDQWGLAAVNATGAWETTMGGDAVVVAVVDSGVDLAHLDLKTNLWDGNALHGTSTARPFGVFGRLPAGPHDTTMDELGHGTAVAGVVGAVAENGLGVRGMAQAPLMVVKVYGLGAPGHAEAVAEGILWAVENGADVVTMSLSGSNHPALRDAVETAWCAGAVIIAASGNAGNPLPSHPARYPEVVSVGAVDRELGVWAQSNRGVDLYAPGVDVLTTDVGNLHGEHTGTSFAAPFVAGTAALVWAANPGLSNVDVMRILSESARPLQDADADLLDAGAAVDLAATSVATPGPDCGS